jgi:hypothetical protein
MQILLGTSRALNEFRAIPLFEFVTDRIFQAPTAITLMVLGIKYLILDFINLNFVCFAARVEFNVGIERTGHILHILFINVPKYNYDCRIKWTRIYLNKMATYLKNNF